MESVVIREIRVPFCDGAGVDQDSSVVETEVSRSGSMERGYSAAGKREHRCSARAVMVSDGLTPRLAPMTEPSMT